MNRLFVLALAGLATAAEPAPAAVITYTTWAGFDAAAPGVPVEGFQNATSSATQVFTGPLNSGMNSGPFTPNTILPGITVANSSPHGSDLFLAGPGQSSNPTLAVGTQNPDSAFLVLQFSPGVTAVAFDLFQNFSGGTQSGSPQTYTVILFDPSNNVLGVFGAGVPSGSAGFFGATSTSDSIGRVEVLGPIALGVGAYEVVDNVAFGSAAAGGVVSTPEPGTVAVFAALGLVACGLRRGKKNA